MNDDDPYRHVKAQADAFAVSVESPLVARFDALTRDVAQIKTDLKTVLERLEKLQKLVQQR